MLAVKQKQSINKRFIKKRQARPLLLGNFVKFTRGDIVALNYRLRGLGFNFTGLCIRVRKQSMLTSNSSFALRNVLGKVPVEVNVALYGLCRMSYKVLDYARKRIYYRSAKLYYLRSKSNKES
jgi:ribosomal protein L19